MSRGALDWSRVADGNATHYDPVYGNFLLQGIDHSLVWHNGRGWARHGGQYPDDLSQLSVLVKREAKPAAWTGEGLPPPGIMVECSWTSGEGSYGKAFTIGHDHDGRLVYQLIETPTGEKVGEIRAIDSNLMLSGPGGALIPKFRPIRTSEQIAAEEREKAVAEMKRIWTSADTLPFHALYDAGLRFQGGAQ